MKNLFLLLILTSFMTLLAEAVGYNSPADNVHMYPAGVSTRFKSYTNQNQVRRQYGNTTVTTPIVPVNVPDYSPYRPNNFAYEKIYSNRTLWFDAEVNRVGTVVQYSDGRTVIYDANGNVMNVLHSSN